MYHSCDVSFLEILHFFQVTDFPYKIGHITNKMKNLKIFSTSPNKLIFLFSHPYSIPNPTVKLKNL